MATFGAKVRLTLDKGSKGDFYTQIQNAANSKPIKVNNVIIDENTRSGLSKQIIDSITQSPIAIDKIEIKSIDASKAVANLRKQLTSMLDGLSIRGVKDFIGGNNGAGKNLVTNVSTQVRSKTQELTDMQSALDKLYERFNKTGALEKQQGLLEKIDALHTSIQQKKDRIGKHGESSTDIRAERQGIEALEREAAAQEATAEAARKAAEVKKAASEEAAKAAENEAKKTEELQRKAAKTSAMDVLRPQKKAAEASMEKMYAGGFDADEVSRLAEEYQKYIDALNNLKSGATPVTPEAVENVKAMGDAVLDSTKKLLDSADAHEKNADAADRDAQQALRVEKSVADLSRQITAQLHNIPGLADSDIGARLKEILEELSGGNVDSSRLRELTTEWSKLKLEIEQTRTNGAGFFGTFTNGLRSIVGFAAISTVIHKIVNEIKQMVAAVKEIDSAMVELKKVTDMTSAGYDAFYKNAVNASQRIGATVSDTINATADFARLGYNTNEALELAQAALTYKNVGDGIDNVGQATESLISTIKAFRLESTDAMMVIDEFNEVGKWLPKPVVTRCLAECYIGQSSVGILCA